MKRIMMCAALAVAVGIASSAVAGDHRFDHSVARFVEAWNAHDLVAMQTRWTADATVVDAHGKLARGRAAAAALVVAGGSQLRITSALIQRKVGRGSIVDFDAEITGMGTIAPAPRVTAASLVFSVIGVPQLAWLAARSFR